LWDGTNFLPFWQIASDGNLLPQAIQLSSVRIAVAERVDIIVDFSKIKAARIYFVNRLEQINGRGPTGKTRVRRIYLSRLSANSSKSTISPSLNCAAIGSVGSRPCCAGTIPPVGLSCRDNSSHWRRNWGS
jgi:hypothetical protein